MRDPQRAKSGPRRWWSRRGTESAISRHTTALLLREQRLERAPPARTQRGDAQRPLEQVAGMTGLVQQRVDLEDGHTLSAYADLDNLIARLDLTLCQNPQIETGPAVRHQQGRHPRLVHANTNPVTSNTRLCHFKQNTPDPVAVADTDLPVRQALDREVLAELSVNEVVAPQFFLPILIGVDLINENSAMLTAVSGQVALPIAIDVETPDYTRPLNCCFPNRGVHDLPLPCDIPRQPHVD